MEKNYKIFEFNDKWYKTSINTRLLKVFLFLKNLKNEISIKTKTCPNYFGDKK